MYKKLCGTLKNGNCSQDLFFYLNNICTYKLLNKKSTLGKNK